MKKESDQGKIERKDDNDERRSVCTDDDDYRRVIKWKDRVTGKMRRSDRQVQMMNTEL